VSFIIIILSLSLTPANEENKSRFTLNGKVLDGDSGVDFRGGRMCEKSRIL